MCSERVGGSAVVMEGQRGEEVELDRPLTLLTFCRRTYSSFFFKSSVFCKRWPWIEQGIKFSRAFIGDRAETPLRI